ncbi:antigen WC1.1-like, partial [Dasypus novemcinctus]|uniref:antigen WC1.1-like n=1 Tax=Dasypus novemcinctus TaxID=9361 RepID=UPI0039C94EC1
LAALLRDSGSQIGGVWSPDSWKTRTCRVGPETLALSQAHPVQWSHCLLFSAGERTTLPPSARGPNPPGSAPIPSIFSLPGILCLILGALLFLVLIILATQLHRWRAEHRALLDYEDALDEALYQEIDYLVKPEKEDLLSSAGNLSGDSVTRLPYYTGDNEEDGNPKSTPEAPGQCVDATGNGYDDVEELPIPEIPPVPEINGNYSFSDERDGARYSQTDASLQSPRETVNPRVEGRGSSLVLGQEEDRGYDDVELSTM